MVTASETPGAVKRRMMGGDEMIEVRIPFQDRREAGQALAAALASRGMTCSAVLGLVRGGVPVAFEVASALKTPMDVLVVKKLRAPMQQELAIGAICTDGTRRLRQDVIREMGVTREYLDHEVQSRLNEGREAERIYRGRLPALDLSGASVLVVDDGVATGATMEAAALSVRRQGAGVVTLAAPVASQAASEALRRVADEVVCLATPADFWAVGQFYLRFDQVKDDEVRGLLEESRGGQARKEGP